VSTPDLALIDTDVASVLYRSGLFQRVMPAELVQAVTGHWRSA
jgi:tetrahydromethanopterin S-methyltransferase subunit F